MYKKEKITKENIKEAWKNLVYSEGYDEGQTKHLQTWDICSMYDVELNNSTIDEVVLLPDGQIRFFYNINTGDYDEFRNFKYSDLRKFYKDFIDAYNKEEEYVMMENAGEGERPVVNIS
jgi:hypothetical protein